jgi:hypothetical protein
MMASSEYSLQIALELVLALALYGKVILLLRDCVISTPFSCTSSQQMVIAICSSAA